MVIDKPAKILWFKIEYYTQQELAFLRVLLCWMASADFLFELYVANSISCQ